jgi:serine/threonine-protein kinase
MLGKTLNHYTIIESLGKGGMGEVYLARDTKLNRKVALKVLDPGTAGDPSRRARFEREAQAIAALNHPNIVTVYSVEEAGEVRFITMELIEGTTLGELIQPGGMELKKMFDIGLALSDALAAAHQQGITHRDLKPDNVMVTRDGRAKVLDFGLAKLLEDDAPGGDIGQLATRELTQPGLLVGTVPYMSPEQIEGKLLDSRSDIFSLGIILFQMATGSRPFQGESGPSLMSAILRDTPQPVTASRADLPRHLARIILRCLEKDPDDRYQSARDVRYELRSVVKEVASGDSEPAPPVLPDQAQARHEKKERHQTHPAVAITAIVAGMIISVFVLMRGWPGGNGEERPPVARGERSAGAPTTSVPDPIRAPAAPLPGGAGATARPGIVVLPLANLSGDSTQEFFADGMTEALITDLAKIGGLRVISRGSVMRYKKSGTAIPEIAAQLGVAYVLEGSVLRAGDRVRISTQLIAAAQDEHLWAENYEEDIEDILSVQARVAREVAGQVKVQLSADDVDRLAGAGPVNPEAYQLYLKGRNVIDDRTVESLRSGLGFFEQALAIEPDLALAWAGKGSALALLGEYSAIPPAEAWPRAKSAALKALDRDDRLSEAYAVLGEVHHYGDWNYEAAERALRRAIDLNPGNATAHQWYGEVLSGMGREDESRRELALAQDLDPHSKIKRSATILFGQIFARRFEDAIRESRVFVEDEPGSWLACWTRGLALDATREYEEAIPILKSSVELSGRTLYPVASLAAAYASLGREAEARDLLNELLERSESAIVLPSYIAIVYAALGDHDNAFAQIDKAIRQRDNAVMLFHLYHYFDRLKADPRYGQTIAKIRAARRE